MTVGGCATARTDPAANVTSTTATLSGAIRSSSTAGTDYWYEYGPTTAYVSRTPVATVQLPQANTFFPVAVSVGGLTPSGTYHFRLCTKEPSMGHPLCGLDRSFSTAASCCAAVAATDAAADVTATQATLQGNLDPGGRPTEFWFQYGRTTSYGGVTPRRDGGSDSVPRAVYEPINGLRTDTSYHYRLCASNDLGQRCGADGVLRTLIPPPTPSMRPAPT